MQFMLTNLAEPYSVRVNAHHYRFITIFITSKNKCCNAFANKSQTFSNSMSDEFELINTHNFIVTLHLYP